MKKYDHIRSYAIGGEITADKKAQIIADYKKNHASELTGMENDDAIWNMFRAQPIDDSEDMSHQESSADTQAKIKKLRDENPDLDAKAEELRSRGLDISFGKKADADTKTSNFDAAGLLNSLNNTSAPSAKDAIGKAMSGGSPMAVAGAAFGAALGAADQALMGDKKFNQQSQAMDDAANGLANVASQFGPWGQAAAMAIRAANFADKAAGQTVPGYDVNIESSGFSGVNAHGDTASLRLSQSRDVDKMLGRQQQQVQMALAAAQLDKDNSLQQEARGASVQDIINRNQIALAGGLGTTTLGA